MCSETICEKEVVSHGMRLMQQRLTLCVQAPGVPAAPLQPPSKHFSDAVRNFAVNGAANRSGLSGPQIAVAAAAAARAVAAAAQQPELQEGCARARAFHPLQVRCCMRRRRKDEFSYGRLLSWDSAAIHSLPPPAAFWTLAFSRWGQHRRGARTCSPVRSSADSICSAPRAALRREGASACAGGGCRPPDRPGRRHCGELSRPQRLGDAAGAGVVPAAWSCPSHALWTSCDRQLPR